MSDPRTPVDPDDGERRFVEQALLALDGQLGEGEDAEFRAGLISDPGKRRLFVRLCLQTQAIFEVLGPRRQGEIPDAAEPESSDPGPVTDSYRFARAVGSASKRRTWFPWSVAAAACLLSLLTAGWAVRNPPTGGPGLRRTSPPASTARGAPAGSDDLAVVVGLDGARWDPSAGPTPERGGVLGPRRLRLTKGRATLAFLSGVTLTVEGPADLDLVSIDRVFCRQGRLRARVPEGAEGFVVASPGSAVVDMGTEFGLNVEPDGRSRVMVFEGKAEAALLDTAGSPGRTQLVERSMSFDLDPRARRIVAAGPRADGFVAAPDLSVPPLVLDPGYAGAVSRSRPRGYWRFDSLSGGEVPNEVPGAPPLRVSGPVAVDGGPTGNGYAVFKAGTPEQVLYTDEFWEMTRDPGHAVELWFASEGISHASLVGLFPALDRPNNNAGKRRYVHSFFVELTARNRQSLYKPASVRFLHRWPLDITIGNNLLSETVYAPGRWHHVVAQKNGDRMELYFDGVPDRSLPLEADHPTLSCRLVVGRRTPDPLDRHDRRPFVGRLDELAIYDHPLSADEVQAHFRSASAGGDPRPVATDPGSSPF